MPAIVGVCSKEVKNIEIIFLTHVITGIYYQLNIVMKLRFVEHMYFDFLEYCHDLNAQTIQVCL